VEQIGLWHAVLPPADSAPRLHSAAAWTRLSPASELA